MVYYALGSILFAGAMVAAFAIMAREFAQYRHAMMAALRGLSMDGLDMRPAKPVISLTSSSTSLSLLPHVA